MFAYQLKDGSLCITFKDNKPVAKPEIVVTEAEGAAKVTINGKDVQVATDAAADETVEA